MNSTHHCRRGGGLKNGMKLTPWGVGIGRGGGYGLGWLGGYKYTYKNYGNIPFIVGYRTADLSLSYLRFERTQRKSSCSVPNCYWQSSKETSKISRA